KGNAIKAYQKGLIINGDPHAVAFGVIAAAKTIRQGTAAVDVDRTPSWEEAYNMGIGKVTGSWDEIPWTRIALVGVGLLAAYGFATGLGKGIVSRWAAHLPDASRRSSAASTAAARRKKTWAVFTIPKV